MRAVIFCGGEIVDYDRVRARIRQGDMLICADSGYRHAKIMGLRPDIVLGDFDSYEKAVVDCDPCVDISGEKRLHRQRNCGPVCP